MKNIYIYISLLAIVLLGSSCADNDTIVTGSGPTVDLEVIAPHFHGVAVVDQCDVTITIGAKQSVTLHAQANVMNVMNYVVKDGILNIGFNENVNVTSHSGVAATIVMTEVDFLSLTGAGSYLLAGAPQDELDIYITGAGSVDAVDLPVLDCSIDITGVGDCMVNVSDNLDIFISGTGNIYYKGSPVITQNISGIGNIQQID